MAGITRYWTPFTGTNNLEIKHGRDKYLQKPTTCRVLDVLTKHSLAFMDPAETLIIDGHGQKDSFVLTEGQGGQGRMESVKSIAGALRNAGLPEEHVRIRILGCETENFARFLAKELGTTHPRIVVGGYKYSIYVGHGHRSLVDVPGQQWPVANTTGSGNVAWFDAKGNVVSKPTQKVTEKLYDPYLDTLAD